MQVLLADNQERERSALRRLLEREPELNIAGEATTAQELLEQLRQTRSDLILLSWELPGLRSGDFVAALRVLYGPIKVIAFSKSRTAKREAFRAGVDAYVSQEDPLEWLLITLRRIGGFSPCFVG